MSSDGDKKPGVVGVATSGIQDVSALLPLLGTEQCERLVTSALQRGLLYAAATPMSIFGSLGIVKAGFIVLWASIDHRFFPGPTLLHNAGITPTGMGKLLEHVAESNRHLYVAEDKLRRHLSKIKIRSVKVNVHSKDLWYWNLRLVGMTALLSSLAMLPYVYLIVRFLSDDPFHSTWLYPLIRIVGCGMIATSIQFVFQLRVLEEAYCRIRFLSTDSYLKDYGRSVPEFWDPNVRSRNVLSQLLDSYHTASLEKQEAAEPVVPHRHRIFHSRPIRSGSTEAIESPIVQGLDYMTSFSFPVRTTPSSPPPVTPTSPPGATHFSTTSTTIEPEQASDGPNAAEKGEMNGNIDAEEPRVNGRFDKLIFKLPRINHSLAILLLFLARVFLLLGLLLSVVGYVGCFSVVQATHRNSSAPLVWLICEALLAIVRTLFWAWNPTWDDPKSPIALEKIEEEALSQGGKDDLTRTKKSSYGIGWMLDSVTANDMHALIVGINEFNLKGFEHLTDCVADARKIADYLQDTLLVPRSQIVTLIDSEATKERIVEELKALAHKTSVVDGAPIVIYFATHSFIYRYDKSTYLVPYVDAHDDVLDPLGVGTNVDPEPLKHDFLAYSAIVDILKHVSEEKSYNITLILDSCNAAAMGVNEKFRGAPPRPIHPPKLDTSAGARGITVVDDCETEEHVHNLPAYMGTYRGIQPMTKESTEILVGHPSHILLAGTSAGNLAYEDQGNGGLFTRTLLEVLGEIQESGASREMTYKKLVEEINEKMKKSDRGQEAICTTIYQQRLLFNGLFSRKLNEKSSTPVITVLYSDL